MATENKTEQNLAENCTTRDNPYVNNKRAMTLLEGTEGMTQEYKPAFTEASVFYILHL